MNKATSRRFTSHDRLTEGQVPTVEDLKYSPKKPKQSSKAFGDKSKKRSVLSVLGTRKSMMSSNYSQKMNEISSKTTLARGGRRQSQKAKNSAIMVEGQGLSSNPKEGKESSKSFDFTTGIKAFGMTPNQIESVIIHGNPVINLSQSPDLLKEEPTEPILIQTQNIPHTQGQSVLQLPFPSQQLMAVTSFNRGFNQSAQTHLIGATQQPQDLQAYFKSQLVFNSNESSAFKGPIKPTFVDLPPGGNYTESPSIIAKMKTSKGYGLLPQKSRRSQPDEKKGHGKRGSFAQSVQSVFNTNQDIIDEGSSKIGGVHTASVVMPNRYSQKENDETNTFQEDSFLGETNQPAHLQNYIAKIQEIKYHKQARPRTSHVHRNEASSNMSSLNLQSQKDQNANMSLEAGDQKTATQVKSSCQRLPSKGRPKTGVSNFTQYMQMSQDLSHEDLRSDDQPYFLNRDYSMGGPLLRGSVTRLLRPNTAIKPGRQVRVQTAYQRRKNEQKEETNKIKEKIEERKKTSKQEFTSQLSDAFQHSIKNAHFCQQAPFKTIYDPRNSLRNFRSKKFSQTQLAKGQAMLENHTIQESQLTITQPKDCSSNRFNEAYIQTQLRDQAKVFSKDNFHIQEVGLQKLEEGQTRKNYLDSSNLISKSKSTGIVSPNQPSAVAPYEASHILDQQRFSNSRGFQNRNTAFQFRLEQASNAPQTAIDKLTDHAHSSSGQDSKQAQSALSVARATNKLPLSSNPKSVSKEAEEAESLIEGKPLNAGTVRIITAPPQKENSAVGLGRGPEDNLKQASSILIEGETSKDQLSQPSVLPLDQKFVPDKRALSIKNVAIVENSRKQSEVVSPSESAKKASKEGEVICGRFLRHQVNNESKVQFQHNGRLNQALSHALHSVTSQSLTQFSITGESDRKHQLRKMLLTNSSGDNLEFDVPSYIDNPLLLEEYAYFFQNQLLLNRNKDQRFVYNNDKKVVNLSQPKFHQSILYPRMTVKGKKQRIQNRYHSFKQRKHASPSETFNQKPYQSGAGHREYGLKHPDVTSNESFVLLGNKRSYVTSPPDESPFFNNPGSSFNQAYKSQGKRPQQTTDTASAQPLPRTTSESNLDFKLDLGEGQKVTIDGELEFQKNLLAQRRSVDGEAWVNLNNNEVLYKYLLHLHSLTKQHEKKPKRTPSLFDRLQSTKLPTKQPSKSMIDLSMKRLPMDQAKPYQNMGDPGNPIYLAEVLASLARHGQKAKASRKSNRKVIIKI